MNERMKNIIKDFAKNQIGPDEPFKFHCTMCSKCCINREDILLNPRDMYNLAKELGMTPHEVMNTYCETYIGSDSRMPVVRLKPRGENEFGVPVEDEFFIEWQRCLLELSTRLRRLEKKLGADMGPIWSLTGSVLYLIYDMEEPFEPQFRAHVGELQQMIHELAGEGIAS